MAAFHLIIYGRFWVITEEGNDEYQAICRDIFADPSLCLPRALSHQELPSIFSTTNKMRNDWTGHGGVVGPEEAQLRNELLVSQLQHLRDAFSDIWTKTRLIRALHCVPSGGVFGNELMILMGSNSEFIKEMWPMATWLDVERIYLFSQGAPSALKLLPLVQISHSPESAKNACYFFNRLDRDGARFVSYHYVDKPEIAGRFDDATQTIKLLSEG